jgi:ParB-like chromosome segregation protein Spo0J
LSRALLSDVTAVAVGDIAWDDPDPARAAQVDELAESFTQHGQLHPVLLRWCTRETDDGPQRYRKAVFGRVRLAAAVKAGLTHIGAMTLSEGVSDVQAMLISLAENTHRTQIPDGRLDRT